MINISGVGVKTLKEMFSLSLMTSLMSGGDWRKDSDTTIEVDPIEIYVADRDNRTFKILKLPAQSGVAHSGSALSRLDLDSNGLLTLNAFSGQMTEKEKMEGNIQLGIVSHFDGVNIDEEFTTISAIFGVSATSNQDMFATGDKLQSGLEFIKNANLTFGLTAGTYMSPFAQQFHICPEQPYINSIPAIATMGGDANTSFARIWYGNTDRLGVLSAFTTTLDPTVYDDPTIAPTAGAPSGSLSGLESQNIYLTGAKSKTGYRLIAEYGRIPYPKIADAQAAAINEYNTRGHALNVDGGFSIGIVSLVQSATDLTNPTHALFTAPPSILTTTKA